MPSESASFGDNFNDFRKKKQGFDQSQIIVRTKLLTTVLSQETVSIQLTGDYLAHVT